MGRHLNPSLDASENRPRRQDRTVPGYAGVGRHTALSTGVIRYYRKSAGQAETEWIHDTTNQKRPWWESSRFSIARRIPRALSSTEPAAEAPPMYVRTNPGWMTIARHHLIRGGGQGR